MSGLFKDNKPRPTRDTQTGKDYRSRNQAGKAVAPEFGSHLHNLVWYEVLKVAAPYRFVDIKTGKPILPNGRIADI